MAEFDINKILNNPESVKSAVQLPNIPAEAASLLHDFWIERREHREPNKSWSDMSEEECNEYEKYSKKVGWIHTVLGDRGIGLGFQKLVSNEFGVVYPLLVNAQDYNSIPEEELAPNTYVVFPSMEERDDEALVIYKVNLMEEWTICPLLSLKEK